MNEKVRRLTLQQNVKDSWREGHWNGKQSLRWAKSKNMGKRSRIYQI